MTVGEMIAALRQHHPSKPVVIGISHEPVEILAVMDWGACGVAITAAPPTGPVELGELSNTESSPNNNMSSTPAEKGGTDA